MDFRAEAAAVARAQPRDPTSRGRSHYRHTLTCLAYVRLDHANGGIIRNVSESGIAVQAVGRLHPEQVVHLRFELLKPKIRIDATGEVVWADHSGQAGVRFIDLSARTQHLLRDWVFTDLLGIASQFGPNRSPIFSNPAEAERADGLLLSAAPLPAIELPEATQLRPADALVQPAAEMPIRLSWWPGDIYPRTLARFVDTVVVISAVLLFSVIAIEGTGIFPSWLVAAPLAIGLGAIFGAVYYCFFRYLAGSTLGNYLARLAAEDTVWMEQLNDDSPRFR